MSPIDYLRAMTKRNRPLRCACVAIYSECRCLGTNISARTKAADFHVEQQ